MAENGGRSIYGPATKVCQASGNKTLSPPQHPALDRRVKRPKKSRKNYARHVNVFHAIFSSESPRYESRPAVHPDLTEFN
jgi:hypothetical protein